MFGRKPMFGDDVIAGLGKRIDVTPIHGAGGKEVARLVTDERGQTLGIWTKVGGGRESYTPLDGGGGLLASLFGRR